MVTLVRRGAAVAGAMVAVAGLCLVVASVAQHLHHDATLAAQAAKNVEVDRRAADEARRATHAVRPAPTSVSTVTAAGAELVVPALGVRAPIVATGAVDASMIIPADIHTVGWYDGLDSAGSAPSGRGVPTAPFPGQPGVALLAGHVDWAGQGPGALYSLDRLQRGDPVVIVGSNGVQTNWQVSQAPLTISKGALPASLFVDTGPPKLALVTCGGPYDAATGHYQDNVIVWASPATPGPPSGG